MSDNQLMTVNGTAVQAYGERSEIREIADRLMALHPNAQQLGQRTMNAVAQLAILTGANPLPMVGEVWAWRNWDGTIAVDLGIAYYRRKSKEKDSVIWVDEPRKATNEEREKYGVSEGDVCSVARALLRSEYFALLDRGVPWQAAKDLLSRETIAIVGHNEMFYPKDTKKHKKGDPIAPPKSQTWQVVCDKRAEKAIYKMLGLVDTTLTDHIQSMNQALIDVGARDRFSPSECPVDMDELNRDLFGYVPANDDVIEGETVVAEAEVVPEDDENEDVYGREVVEAPITEETETPKMSLESCKTLAEFAVTFAAGHPYYKNNFHVVGVLKKKWPNVGVSFARRDPQEYIDYLDQYAHQAADQEEL